MLHYHGLPITPKTVFYALRGRHFCVSFATCTPMDVKRAHTTGQSVLIDNGAFSLWGNNSGQPYPLADFIAFSQPWLDYRTTWCIIPDVIDGSIVENAELIAAYHLQVGHFRQAAPVWHIHESLDWLDYLTHNFERVCFGSSGQYAVIGDQRWHERMDEVFSHICSGTGLPPCWIHMLRGMDLAGSVYPFSSVDSTNIARNHFRNSNGTKPRTIEEKVRWAVATADRLDGVQCPALYLPD